MTEVPVDTAVSMPEDEPMVATDVVPLVHVPPGVASVSGVVAPAHADESPLIPDMGLTVTVVVVKHPDSVYVIAGVPVAMPETTPEEEPTLASEVLLLVHVPPGKASPKAVVEPTHTLVVPVIADGVWLTVIVFVDVHPAISV